MMMNVQSTRIPVALAAIYLGVSVSMLNKLRTYGGGPVYSKLGRRVVYDVADLDRYLAEARRASTSSLSQG